MRERSGKADGVARMRSERLDDDFLFFHEASKQAKMGRMGDIITNRTKQNCAFGPSFWNIVFSLLFVGTFGWHVSLFSYFLLCFSGASDSGIVSTMGTAMATACIFEEKSSGCAGVLCMSGKLCISFFQFTTFLSFKHAGCVMDGGKGGLVNLV